MNITTFCMHRQTNTQSINEAPFSSTESASSKRNRCLLRRQRPRSTSRNPRLAPIAIRFSRKVPLLRRPRHLEAQQRTPASARAAPCSICTKPNLQAPRRQAHNRAPPLTRPRQVNIPIPSVTSIALFSSPKSHHFNGFQLFSFNSSHAHVTFVCFRLHKKLPTKTHTHARIRIRKSSVKFFACKMSLTNQLLCRLLATSYHCNKLSPAKRQTSDPKNNKNIQQLSNHSNQRQTTRSPRVTQSDLVVVSRLHSASLNGLPGHFIGAGQASSSATVEPPAQHPPSTSTTTSTEILKLAPGQTAMDQSSSSESPIQALGEMISSSTGNSRPTHLLNSKPAPPQEAATGHQSNLINGNNRQQATDNFKHPIHGGPLATTNTISVHQQPTVSSVLASSTIPSSTTTQSLPKLDTTSNSNQNNLHLLNNGPAVNTQAPISNQGATSFSVQSPVSSSSPIGATGSAKEQHPSINLVQPPLMTNGGRGSGGNVLASSAGYAPPARSLHHQNSLASTKYSLDGIIATAILGGFIFLGAIITIIVIILRR